MLSSKLQLKIFLTPETAAAATGAAAEALIGVFQGWIRARRLPELLIDVANYTHVPEGPGVVLIGHGSDYGLDLGAGRAGLLHNRKRAGLGPSEALGDLARRTLHAADLLEREPTLGGRLHFATNELLFRINDRLAAPNDEETWAAVKPELSELAAHLFTGSFQLTREGTPKELFTARLTTSAPAVPLATLLERAGGPPVADASLVT
jgi:hypothetical protein